MSRFNFRSSVTGRFVSRLFAKCLPWLTVREEVTESCGCAHCDLGVTKPHNCPLECK